jgi:hypothetical protein
MNTLQLAKMKECLLQEIGDASAKDLPKVSKPEASKTNYGSDIDTYKFTIDKIKYGIKIVKKKSTIKGVTKNPKHLEYYVLFGIEQKGFGDMLDYYKEVNNPRGIFKVMSVVANTVKKSAIKDMANGYKIKQLKFSPVKDDDYGEEDTRRERLYFAYIANALGIKDAEDVKSKMSQLDKSGEWTVYIPEDYYFGISKQELDNLIKKKQ